MSDPLTPPGGGTDVQERTEDKVAPPSMYRVILVNDDYTPREFVIIILVSIFKKTRDEARRVMLSAHQGGKSIVGVYTYDVANSRVERAKKNAQAAGYPLTLYTEEV
ncbi:MAG: ATP-dependent Clp protease adaptor ClpS [Spirochaetales bacterium]